MYQQLSDHAARAHMRADRIVEEALNRYFTDSAPVKRKKWPKGFFDPYPHPTDDMFPDVAELRQA